MRSAMKYIATFIAISLVILSWSCERAKVDVTKKLRPQPPPDNAQSKEYHSRYRPFLEKPGISKKIPSLKAQPQAEDDEVVLDFAEIEGVSFYSFSFFVLPEGQGLSLTASDLCSKASYTEWIPIGQKIVFPVDESGDAVLCVKFQDSTGNTLDEVLQHTWVRPPEFKPTIAMSFSVASLEFSSSSSPLLLVTSADAVSKYGLYSDEQCLILITEQEAASPFTKINTPNLPQSGSYHYYLKAVNDNNKAGPCIKTPTYKYSAPDTKIVDIVASRSGYAILRSDGSARVWSSVYAVNTCSHLDLSHSVRKIHGGQKGFVFIMEDGSLQVCSEAVHFFNLTDGVKGFESIYSNNYTFAATKPNGEIYSFGTGAYGGIGNHTNPPDLLTKIAVTSGSYTALFDDGSTISWGSDWSGGDSSAVNLSAGVLDIAGNDSAFAAVLSDGNVKCWGSYLDGGTCNIAGSYERVYASANSFVAVDDAGDGTCWGDGSFASNCSAVDFSPGIREIYPIDAGFIALMEDDDVRAWGATYISNLTGLDFSAGIESIYTAPKAALVITKDDIRFTWGLAGEGGDSTGVDLSGTYQKVLSTDKAFGILKTDGSFVSWGDDGYGADPGDLDLSADVSLAAASSYGFAAIKSDNKIYDWGYSPLIHDKAVVNYASELVDIWGNDEGNVGLRPDGSLIGWGSQDLAQEIIDLGLDTAKVVDVKVTDSAFAALLGDNSVVSFGNPADGGDSSSVDFSGGVKEIFSNNRAFAAIKQNGDVVAWGHASYGGNTGTLDFSAGAVEIYSTEEAFAALMADDTLICWGYSNYGGNCGSIDFTSGISWLKSNKNSFILERKNGTYATWGSSSNGGNSSGVDFTSGIKHLATNNSGYIAVMNDGRVEAWGTSLWGHDLTGIDFSKGVKSLVGAGKGYAALLNDNSVISWGYYVDSSGLDLTNVAALYSNGNALAALKDDGSVIAWGGEKLEHGGSHLYADVKSGVTDILPLHHGFVALKAGKRPVFFGSYQMRIINRHSAYLGQIHPNHIKKIKQLQNGGVFVFKIDGSAPLGLYHSNIFPVQ